MCMCMCARCACTRARIYAPRCNCHALPLPRRHVMCVEVVEAACGIAPMLMGEVVENVASGIDCYSLRQPLGVRRTPNRSTDQRHAACTTDGWMCVCAYCRIHAQATVCARTCPRLPDRPCITYLYPPICIIVLYTESHACVVQRCVLHHHPCCTAPHP